MKEAESPILWRHLASVWCALVAGLGISCRNVEVTENIRIRRAHDDSIRSIVVDPNGRFFASGGDDHVVRIWSIEDGRLVTEMTAHSRNISQVAFDPSGSNILTGSMDRTTMITTLDNNESTVLASYERAVSAVCYSADGSLIGTACYDCKVRIYRASGGRAIQTIECGDDAPLAIAFHPRERRIAISGSSKNIELFDIDTGQRVRTLGQARDSVIRISFDREGRILASEQRDWSLSLWDVNQVQLPFQIDGEAPGALSLDGRLLVTGSNAGVISLWDVQSRRKIGRRSVHEDAIVSVGFSPNNETVVTGGQDGEIGIWSVNGIVNKRVN